MLYRFGSQGNNGKVQRCKATVEVGTASIRILMLFTLLLMVRRVMQEHLAVALWLVGVKLIKTVVVLC